ncbi:hypothetical protein EDB19DRAFT_731686 [Suillus lakei]|nr:hypothetical protein EDB19DRAFT_731686 [Suillus lakei]
MTHQTLVELAFLASLLHARPCNHHPFPCFLICHPSKSKISIISSVSYTPPFFPLRPAIKLCTFLLGYSRAAICPLLPLYRWEAGSGCSNALWERGRKISTKLALPTLPCTQQISAGLEWTCGRWSRT